MTEEKPFPWFLFYYFDFLSRPFESSTLFETVFSLFRFDLCLTDAFYSEFVQEQKELNLLLFCVP